MINWMLYHVCRYRDGRNIRAARARDFHADDDLDEGKRSFDVHQVQIADGVNRRTDAGDNGAFTNLGNIL